MKTNRNIRTTNSQVMDLKQLIAGPLIATIDADSLSTRRYLDCLFEIAFEHYDKSTGKTGSLRTLSFTFVAGSNGNKKKQKVTIPILTLVPLPLLQVKEADFDFDIKILDAQQQSTEEAFSLKEGKLIPAQEEAGLTMRASLAPKQEADYPTYFISRLIMLLWTMRKMIKKNFQKIDRYEYRITAKNRIKLSGVRSFYSGYHHSTYNSKQPFMFSLRT